MRPLAIVLLGTVAVAYLIAACTVVIQAGDGCVVKRESELSASTGTGGARTTVGCEGMTDE